MKNKLSLIVLPLLLYSCHAQIKYPVFLGQRFEMYNVDAMSVFANKYDNTLNYDFYSWNFYIRDLYYLLDKNGSNLETNKHINDVLKNANKIILNLGNYDLFNNISIYDEEIRIDNEKYNESLEIYQYYLYHVLDILNDFTNRIYVIASYNDTIYSNTIQQRLISFFDQWNNVVYQTCLSFENKYVLLSRINKYIVSHQILNEAGIDYIVESINRYDDS